MLSHFLLPKEHTVHLSTARLPLPPLKPAASDIWALPQALLVPQVLQKEK